MDSSSGSNYSNTNINYTIIGPIKLNESSMERRENTIIVQAKSSNSNTFFIALNCYHNKINVTSDTFIWKQWTKPRLDFEHQIIKRLCSY